MKRIRLNKIISLIISFVMVLALFPSYSLGAAYNLTINYKYENGDKAADAYTASVDVDVPYSVASPDIAGYQPNQTTVSGTMPAEDVVVNVTYHPTYTATIHYQYEDGTEAYPSYVDQLLVGDTYDVASPSITGYKPDQATVSGTMAAENVETTVTYHTAYTLTIRYQNTDGTEASAPYTSALAAGDTYSVTSPTITGYRPDQATVSGTMAAANADVTVVYHKTYTLTIHYLYLDSTLPGYPVAESAYTGEYLPGEGYSVASPSITHYFASQADVVGTMPEANVDVTVTYVSYHVHINVHYKYGGSSPVVQQFDKYVDYSTLSGNYRGSNILLVNSLWEQTGRALGWKTSAAYEPSELVSNGSTGLSPSVSSTSYNYTVDVYLKAPPDHTSYTVSYNANGGTGTMTDPNSPYYVGNSSATFKVLSSSFTPPTGKHFVGWNLLADGTGTTYVVGSTYSIIGNITLYAQWEYDAQYSVTYSANGGSGSVPTGGSSYHQGDRVTVLFTPLPTRSGYNFLGWSTSSGATSATYTASGLKTITIGTSNVTLYAVWDAIEYSVSYAANGGTGTMTDPSNPYYYGNQFTVLANTFTAPANKHFTGWNTASDGHGTNYTVGTAYTISGNVTLYAQWALNPKYSVTYNRNGGSGSMTDPASPYYDGSSFTVRTNTFTAPTNKHFTGWNTASDGSGTSYTAGTSYTISANVTLYAQWAFNAQYAVTYNANGGSGTMTDPSSPYYENTRFTVRSNSFTAPTNKHFTGWNTATDGSGTNYNAGSSYTITGDVTLYAQWAFNAQYTVTYYANGGTGTMTDASSPYYANNSFTVLENTFTAPTNKHFVGWSTDSDGHGTDYTAGRAYTITGNVKLYAQWDWNEQYWVLYDPNGGLGIMYDWSNPYFDGTTVTVKSNGFLAPMFKRFVGWNTERNGSGTSYSAGSTFTITDDVVLYAQWGSNTQYTVSYNANGGSGSVPTGGSYYAGDLVTVLFSPTPTRSGYSFRGWATSSGATTATYTAGGTTSFNMGTSNVTLYAVFSKDSFGYTVNYYKDSIAAGNLINSDVNSGTFGDPIPYTDGKYLPAGYKTPGTVTGQATITEVAANNVRNVVYSKDSFGYTVNYYTDSISAANLITSDTGTGTFGDAIPYTDGSYLPAGYKATGDVTGQMTITEVSADNVISVVYSKDSFGYTVNYYKDSISAANLITSDTGTGTFGDAIPYTDGSYLPAGYKATGDVTGQMMITEVSADNVINVVYSKDSFGYTVNYYKDSIAAANLITSGTGTGTFGDAIPYTDGSYLPAGYKATGDVTGQMTITEVSADNVTNVVYSKDIFGYTVNYYKDSIAVGNLLNSDTGTGTFGDAIPYTDGKYLPAGYKATGDVTGQMTITEVSADNVISVVYSKDSFGYTVNYYKDSISAANLLNSDTNTGIFGDPIPYTDGKYLPAGYAIPGTVTGQATITEVAANNVRNVVYAKGTFGYTVNYYINSVTAGNLINSDTNTGTFGDPIPYTDGKYLPAGYAIPGTVTGQATITEVAANNVRNVVYALVVYPITYTLNGGVNGANPATYTVESPTIALADATQAGYAFLGWTPAGVIPTGSTGARAFAANWSAPLVYDITYVLNGGTNDAGNPATYTVESPTITLAAPTREGYDFLGWTPDGTIPAGSTGDVTFTARWSDAHVHTVTYFVTGGTNAGLDGATPYRVYNDVAYGTVVPVPANPSQDNYTFDGWTTAIPVNMPDQDVVIYGTMTQEPVLPEIITNDETPLAGPGQTWALLNLIMAITNALGISAIFTMLKKKQAAELTKQSKAFRWSTVIPAAAAILAFLLTQNLTNSTMVLTDQWTLLMGAITLIQAVVVGLGFGKKWKFATK